MNAIINEDLLHIVILDISGVYAQIHNQGYFDKETLDDIKKQYSDMKYWRILVLDEQ